MSHIQPGHFHGEDTNGAIPDLKDVEETEEKELMDDNSDEVDKDGLNDFERDRLEEHLTPTDGPDNFGGAGW